MREILKEEEKKEREERERKINNLKETEYELEQKKSKIGKARREIENETPLVKKIGVTVASTAVLSGLAWAASKNQKVTAVSGIIAFVGTFLIQK